MNSRRIPRSRQRRSVLSCKPGFMKRGVKRFIFFLYRMNLYYETCTDRADVLNKGKMCVNTPLSECLNLSDMKKA